MEMELVAVAMYPTSVEATLAVNRLAEEGIEATLFNENTGDLLHLAAPFGEVKVMVPAEKADRASEILRAVREKAESADDHVSDE